MEGLPDSQEVRGITPNAFQTIFAHIEKSKTQQVKPRNIPHFSATLNGAREVLESTLKGEAERLVKILTRHSSHRPP